MSEMTKKIIRWAIPIVLFLAGCYCLLKEWGYADYYFIPQHNEHNFEEYEARTKYTDNRLTPAAKMKLQEQFDFHHFQGVRCAQEAKDHLWWYPQVTWRDRSRQLWIAACATVGATTACGRLVVAFSALLSLHGVDVIDDWDFVKDKLAWAQYHFNECDKIAQRIQG